MVMMNIAAPQTRQKTEGFTTHHPENIDTVIVGGGIAGLTAAWALREHKILLLEADQRVGGEMKSEVREPYWLNLGAHIVHEGGIIARLASELGVPLIPMKGSFLNVSLQGHLVRARRLEDFIFRLPLSPAARYSLAFTGLRLLTAQFLSCLAVPPKFKNLPRSAQLTATPYLRTLERHSYLDLLGKMHPEVQVLFRVFANRIGGELDEISAFAGLINFEELFSGEVANIKGGSERLPEAIYNALGERAQVGALVTGVEQTKDNVLVEYTEAGERRLVTSKTCIMAVQAPTARQILNNLSQDLDEIFSSLRYTPMVVAGIFTDENCPMPWDDMYALVVPERSFCMLFNPTFVLRTGGERKPGGCLVVYSVAEQAARLLEMSDEAIRQDYLNDIYEIFPQASGIVREVLLQRWPHAVPISFPGRASLQQKITQPWGRITFAGNYVNFVGLGLEISAQSGLDAAEAVRGFL